MQHTVYSIQYAQKKPFCKIGPASDFGAEMPIPIYYL